MKILSLFDGIACGLEALKRAWVKVDMYFASEIDRYAIQIATKNHPEIIEVGDVKNLRGRDYLGIDLLIWGSPCQDLSIAKANREGLQWKRSWLLFNYVEILKTAKPKRFLLENVASMSKENKDAISSLLWVEPILINSALVSGQQRKRLYRTNIPGITQPEDKGIVLKDILEEDVILTDTKRANEPVRLGQYGKGGQGQRIYGVNGKSVSLSANGGGQWAKTWLYLLPKVVRIPQMVRVRKYDVDTDLLKAVLKEHKTLTNKEIAEKLELPITTVEHRFRNDSSFSIPDADIRFRLKELLGITTNELDASITEFVEKEGAYEKAERKILTDGKYTTLTTSNNDEILVDLPSGDYMIRKLTPIECERLQTLPDNYTAGVSDAQRYKMLGNGRTVDVIKHIFTFLPKE